VNVIGCDAVPTADNAPLTRNVRATEFPCTTTPGSTVNVTPAATDTSPVITYGLFAAVQVVFEEIVPDTDVGPEPSAGRAPITAAATITARTAHPSERPQPRKNEHTGAIDNGFPTKMRPLPD
jgi:hypothetical protein